MTRLRPSPRGCKICLRPALLNHLERPAGVFSTRISYLSVRSVLAAFLRSLFALFGELQAGGQYPTDHTDTSEQVILPQTLSGLADPLQRIRGDWLPPPDRLLVLSSVYQPGTLAPIRSLGRTVPSGGNTPAC